MRSIWQDRMVAIGPLSIRCTETSVTSSSVGVVMSLRVPRRRMSVSLTVKVKGGIRPTCEIRLDEWVYGHKGRNISRTFSIASSYYSTTHADGRRQLLRRGGGVGSG